MSSKKASAEYNKYWYVFQKHVCFVKMSTNAEPGK